jgi:hypothetical protein
MSYVSFFEGLTEFPICPFSPASVPFDASRLPIDEPRSDKENTKPDTKLFGSQLGLPIPRPRRSRPALELGTSRIGGTGRRAASQLIASGPLAPSGCTPVCFSVRGTNAHA